MKTVKRVAIGTSIFTGGATIGLLVGGVVGFIGAAYLFNLGMETQKSEVQATMDEVTKTGPGTVRYQTFSDPRDDTMSAT